MQALVYQGAGKKVLQERPMPTIASGTDAIVRILKTTICGTDLHILKGDVKTCAPGRILGHEGVGVVESVGSSVDVFAPGDRVLISCITSCGRCEACRRGMLSHCAHGGWILGHTIDGTQAEFVRVPFADTSLYLAPTDADSESLVLLSDIMPTGFECGVINGRVTPGCTVAIVGAGPVGLATLMTAQFYAPSQVIVIDLDEHRLSIAKTLGATSTIQSSFGKVVPAVKQMTGDRGVDVAIEAVGIPATFNLCEDLVAAGGTIANVGVHGSKVDLHLERLWSHNVTITTRLVDTVSTPMLLRMLTAKQLQPSQLVTHRFALGEMLEAYDVFG
ncbi:MAG: zinc-dependent alcohol dehydrogenase family protein, partial [Planctomycetota bacterium]